MSSGKLFNRNFLLLWQGQVVSLAGTQAYLVAFMFWVAQATDRPALVGTMTMIGGLATFLSPIGGPWQTATGQAPSVDRRAEGLDQRRAEGTE